MEKTRDISVVQNLIDQDKVATLNVVNMMKYEDDWEIIVDNITNPKGFIFNCGYWSIPYSPDDNVISSMLKGKNYKEEEGFAGALYKYYEMVKDLKKIDWEEHCFLYYMEEKDLDESKIRHEVKELRLEDADVVNEFYTYKEDESLDYIKECISERPTSAIFDEAGNPISWAVVREDGTMGIMYTRKEHRGKGLAVSVSIDLAKKVIKNNGTPFVHIVTDNHASIALAESIGFKKYGNIVWFGVK